VAGAEPPANQRFSESGRTVFWGLRVGLQVPMQVVKLLGGRRVSLSTVADRDEEFQA
jgi:hypothetical protein